MRPTSTEINFNENFRPTDEQITEARNRCFAFHAESVFVLVDFPGKQRGLWIEGQARKAVMLGSRPATWIDRDRALSTMESGGMGNACFRVWADGHVSLVDEA